MSARLLTSDVLRKRSAVAIQDPIGKRSRRNPGVGGVCDRRLQDIGAIGHIELGATPVPNGLYLRTILRLLNGPTRPCLNCGSVPAPEHASELWCAACGSESPTFVLYDGFYIRAEFRRRTNTPAVTPANIHAALTRMGHGALYFTDFPCPSIAIRPGRSAPLTLRLRAIVRARNACRGLPPPNLVLQTRERGLRARSAYDRLYKACVQYQDNRLRPKSEKVYGKPKESLISRYCVSKKGRVHATLLSKCTNWVARAVCVPTDDLLSVDVVGVPAWICVRLRLHEGDWVVMQRYPILHRNSQLGFRVHVVTDVTSNVFAMHLATTKGFNLDFDGDEMNLLVPQSVASRADVRDRMAFHRHMLDDDGVPLTGLYMNALLAAYHMTDPATRIERGALAHMLAAATMDTDLPAQELTGQEAFAYILPPTLSFTCADVCVEGGRLLRGRWTAKTLNGAGGLVAQVHRLLPTSADTCAWLGRAYAFLCTWFLTHRGASFLTAEREHLTEGASPHLALHITNCREYTESGVKGKRENEVQLLEQLGQQACFRGTDGFASTVHGDEVCKGGMVTGSFCTGLTDTEHFYHLASSRWCLVETAVQTGDCGMLQRLVTFLLEDTRAYRAHGDYGDGLVRNETGPAAWLVDVPAEDYERGAEVGLWAAAGLCAPLTQANLRTFHHSGADSHLAQGIPLLTQLVRLKEPRVNAVLEQLGCEAARETWRSLWCETSRALGCEPIEWHVSLLAERVFAYGGHESPFETLPPLKRAAIDRPMSIFTRLAFQSQRQELPPQGMTERLMLGLAPMTRESRSPVQESESPQPLEYQPSEERCVTPSYLPPLSPLV